MRTALIFRYELLPMSETFIKSQAGALKNFQACYTGVERAAKSLPIPDDSVLVMSGKSLRGRVERRAFLTAGWAPSFYRRLRDRAPALIHAHFAPDAAIALPLVSEFRIPLIVTLHGYDVTSSEEFLRQGHGRFYIRRRRQLFQATSAFICVSEFIRRKAIEAGFPKSKLLVHYIGVDHQLFTPATQECRRNLVLFVGRLIEKKGCEYLIEAMKRVQQECKETMLVVIGDGPLRPALELLARDKGVSCQFLGSQPSNIVRNWLSQARIFCVPSITARNGDSEGLPIVFTEAQAMGVPVVSSRHAGIPEVVRHGETGLLAAERDHGALADHLVRYLTDEAFWGACSARAREWMQQRFDLCQQTAKLEDIYSKSLVRS
jgi:glycosyltransferase involved in cell wall biosynthesis